MTQESTLQPIISIIEPITYNPSQLDFEFRSISLVLKDQQPDHWELRENALIKIAGMAMSHTVQDEEFCKQLRAIRGSLVTQIEDVKPQIVRAVSAVCLVLSRELKSNFESTFEYILPSFIKQLAVRVQTTKDSVNECIKTMIITQQSDRLLKILFSYSKDRDKVVRVKISEFIDSVSGEWNKESLQRNLKDFIAYLRIAINDGDSNVRAHVRSIIVRLGENFPAGIAQFCQSINTAHNKDIIKTLPDNILELMNPELLSKQQQQQQTSTLKTYSYNESSSQLQLQQQSNSKKSASARPAPPAQPVSISRKSYGGTANPMISKSKPSFQSVSSSALPSRQYRLNSTKGTTTTTTAITQNSQSDNFAHSQQQQQQEFQQISSPKPTMNGTTKVQLTVESNNEGQDQSFQQNSSPYSSSSTTAAAAGISSLETLSPQLNNNTDGTDLESSRNSGISYRRNPKASNLKAGKRSLSEFGTLTSNQQLNLLSSPTTTTTPQEDFSDRGSNSLRKANSELFEMPPPRTPGSTNRENGSSRGENSVTRGENLINTNSVSKVDSSRTDGLLLSSTRANTSTSPTTTPQFIQPIVNQFDDFQHFESERLRRTSEVGIESSAEILERLRQFRNEVNKRGILPSHSSLETR